MQAPLRKFRTIGLQSGEQSVGFASVLIGLVMSGGLLLTWYRLQARLDRIRPFIGKDEASGSTEDEMIAS